MAIVEARNCFQEEPPFIDVPDRMCYSNTILQNSRSSKDMLTRGREIVRGRIFMRKGSSTKVCYTNDIASISFFLRRLVRVLCLYKLSAIFLLYYCYINDFCYSTILFTMNLLYFLNFLLCVCLGTINHCNCLFLHCVICLVLRTSHSWSTQVKTSVCGVSGCYGTLHLHLNKPWPFPKLV